MNNKIYIQSWLDIKPYNKQTKTDSFYLKICNNIKKTLSHNIDDLRMLDYFPENNLDLLSCFLTSYFEDLISGTNIWNTFIKAHNRLYDKSLPFYELDEYYEDEINVQDISFLIWYFMNTLEEEKFIEPSRYFILESAKLVMDIFDKEWDSAPENKKLKNYYHIDKEEEDYYVARYFIETILFETYLFYPDTAIRLKNDQGEFYEKHKNSKNISMLLTENRDIAIHKTHTRLLGLTGKEWASEMLGNDHPLSSDFLGISQRINGYFLYKGQDENDISIKHAGTGMKFKMTKKSFEQSDALSTIDDTLYMSIIRWKNEWWFSGILMKSSFDSELILNERKSLISKQEVEFLTDHKKIADKFLEKQYKSFKKFNNGEQIAFIQSIDIENYLTKFIKHSNIDFNISTKNIEKLKKSEREDSYGIYSRYANPENYSEVGETALVFFNPKKGYEFTLSSNSAFPLPNNPYFNVEDSEEHFIRLLMNNNISTELVLYSINECKSKLPFFNSEEGKLYFNNIDFLLRFLKIENYHTKATIEYL